MAVLVSLVSVNAASATADDEIPSPKPVEIMRRRHDPAITSGQSIVWDLDSPGAVPFYMGYVETPQTPPSPAWRDPRVLCNGATDPACSPSLNSHMNVSTVLGVCESDAEVGCVEALSSRSTGGEFVALTRVDGGVTVHAENPALRLPRSATLSTWQDSSGARYVLTAHMTTWLTAASGSWGVPTSSSLTVMISRIPRATTHPAGSVSIIDSASLPGKKTYSVSNGTPMNTVELTKGLRFNLKIRVPNTVAGWFQGRIANAVVGSKPLSDSRTVYELEGDVASVYVAGGEADSSNPQFPVKPWTYNGFMNSLSNPSVIQDYDKWKPFLNDKAVTTRNEWVLTALAMPNNNCFDASKGLTGVASTNAAFYSPTPPTYNSSTGAVEYKVASPHFDESGNVAVGSYSLSIPTAAIQCMYKVSVEPEAAEVSFKYDDGSDPYVVTQTVTKKDNWINVSVTGIHFSAPTVATRFGTLSANASGTANSNFAALMAGAQASSSSTSTSTLTGNYVKTVISGVKATVTVTLAAKGTFTVYRKVGKKLVLVKKVSGKKGANKVITSYLKGYSFVVKDSKGKTLAVKTTAVRFARYY